jgi:16S rRNA (cytosine967-C5)-methyltransferase
MAKPPARRPHSSTVPLLAFDKLWESLFTSPVHLDSALSKLPAPTKNSLARILPRILMRPASLAEELGVGLPEGEPWSLSPEKLAGWRPARLMTERLLPLLTGSLPEPPTLAEDFPPWMELPPALRDALATEPPLSLRVSRRFKPDEVIAKLKKSELPVRIQRSVHAPQGVVLSGYAPVLGSASYKEGAFEIQDEGSQLMAAFALWPELVAPLLSREPGLVTAASAPKLPSTVPAWTVVDACAGAGGKSLALADLLGGKGRLYSYDISDKKLQALRRRARHAGVTNIQPVLVKSEAEQEVVSRFRRRANVVLVDAPCSGWGVLRRNPDIKWRQDRSALERLPILQTRLLSVYADLVAPGGRLVYGACTFRPAETRDTVSRFLEERGNEFKETEGGFFGPGPTSDGFFMQAFLRKS